MGSSTSKNSNDEQPWSQSNNNNPKTQTQSMQPSNPSSGTLQQPKSSTLQQQMQSNSKLQSQSPSKSQQPQSQTISEPQSKSLTNPKSNSLSSVKSKTKKNSMLKQPLYKQPSIAQIINQSEQSPPPTPKNMQYINSVSQPLTTQQLSLSKLSNEGSIDIVSYVEDARFCHKSKQLKSFRSIKDKVFSRMTWILDQNNQYKVSFQDLKTLQPNQITSTKSKINFIVSQQGQFISLDSKSKYSKKGGYIAHSKLSSKQLLEVQQQVQLIWRMIRKGPMLSDETVQPDENFKVISYKKQSNQKQLMGQYKNFEQYNMNLSDDINIRKWQINSDSQQQNNSSPINKNLNMPMIIQSISDYNRYICLEYPEVPFVAIGNIFRTLMVETNQSLKCDCYLKKYYIIPKWVQQLKEQEQILKDDILKQTISETQSQILNFKKDIFGELHKLNLKSDIRI